MIRHKIQFAPYNGRAWSGGEAGICWEHHYGQQMCFIEWFQ